jgi:hypothetical protein
VVTSVVAHSLQQVNSYPIAVVTARSGWTMTAEPPTLIDWLLVCGCIHVAIESTDDDWKLVFNILEGTCEVALVDVQHGQAIPQCKRNEYRIGMPFQRSPLW